GPVDPMALTTAPFNTSLNYFATARGRLGYAFGPVMPYVTAGVAWGQSKIDINDQDGNPIFPKSWDHLGWTAAIGFEHALKGNWTAKMAYVYVLLSCRSDSLESTATPTVVVDPSIRMIKVGLNYRLWDPAPSPTALVIKAPAKIAAERTFAPENDDFSIHAQT